MKYFEFSLHEFREIMLGKNSKTYPLFKNLRNKIIDVAKKELETKDPETNLYKSDLSFTLETRRTGRKISHLKFIIKKQQTKPIIPIEIDSQDSRIDQENAMEYNEMIKIGVSERQALDFSQA
jgi:plasmid replication initiation protein